MKKKKILLNGYIGHQNFGDDLLFDIAIQKVQKIPNSEIYIVIVGEQINPDYLYKYFSKLIIIRFKKKIPLFFYNKFDKVFYIGGGVFFDYKKELSFKSFCLKYLSNFLRFTVPKYLGTDFGGIGIGIGPYFCEKTKKNHSQIIKNFDILGLRDQVSYDLAKSMGASKLFLSNDISLSLYGDLQKGNNIENKSKEIIICPRTYKHLVEFEKHISELILFADYIEKKSYTTHWVFLQEDDLKLLKVLESKFKVTVWNPKKMKMFDFIALFRNAKVVLTSRMHSIYIAGMVHTPIITIPIHQKLIYASSLFYESPILVDPLSSLEDYITAFENNEEHKLNPENAIKEVNILDKLNAKVDTWLNDNKK